MPISEYTIETHEGRSENVVAALSRFSNVNIERPDMRRLKVRVSTDSRLADDAWRQLFMDLRGVASCSRNNQESESAAS